MKMKIKIKGAFLIWHNEGDSCGADDIFSAV